MDQLRMALTNANVVAKSNTPVKGVPDEEKWLKLQLTWRNKRTLSVDLTPTLAALLMRDNFRHNRPVSDAKVQQYARDIRLGQWKHNGETIKILKSGELGDGQHRCLAVIKAEMPIKTEITFGIDEEELRTVDAGLKRTIGQQLHMTGTSDSNLKAAIAQSILSYQRDRRLDRTQSHRIHTQTEVVQFCQEHDLTAAISHARPISKKLNCVARLAGALYYIFAEIDTEAANKFFDSIALGTDLSSNSPVYRLREKLLSIKKPEKTDFRICCIFIIAWNAYRRNASLRSFPKTDELPHPI